MSISVIRVSQLRQGAQAELDIFGDVGTTSGHRSLRHAHSANRAIVSKHCLAG